MKRCFQFIIAMIISFLPGIFGVFFTPHGHSNLWYNGLIKSALTPPGWVFSVAWTILYAMLGWALYLIIKSVRGAKSKLLAYILFGAQILLNACWSLVFFDLHFPAFALIILMFLFIISAWMARVFAGIDRNAAYLIIPYLLWMMFAFYMNAFIVMMN